MKKIIFSILSLLFIATFAIAQSPKRELRSAWLATVYQIDWPKSKITSTGNTTQIQTQKNKLIELLEGYKAANINAFYIQVRSRCDAFYQSSYEPWSEDLVYVRGLNPGYDPLAFAIEEGHKRGMEVHAWINPYRFESANYQWSGKSGDYRKTNPDWLLTYSNNTILNPGHPEVVKRIKSIVGEIVTKYNVDGIIFDDYFYVNGTTDAMDNAQYQLYNPDNLARNDWRRQNVNKMIRSVRDTIKSIKPFVKFGVSPAGVAASNPAVAAKYGVRPAPVGSDWQYNQICSDPLAWLSEGSLDYISPQIYWTIGSTNDYAQLAKWWSEIANIFGKHFYSSQELTYMTETPSPILPKRITINGVEISDEALSGIEKASFSSQSTNMMRAPSAMDFYASEIGAQVEYNRNEDLNGAPGSVFYATTKTVQPWFVDYIKNNQFNLKSLPPAINWQGYTSYGLVSGITLNGSVLSWNAADTDLRYTIYAIPNDKLAETGNFAKADYILGISYSTSFTIPSAVSLTENTFAVAVMDRYGNEFAPKLMNQSDGTPVSVSLVSPNNAANIMLPFTLQWDIAPGVDFYTLEIAEDNLFTKPIYYREITQNSLSTTNIQTLKDGKTYFWRVKTRKPNAPDGISEVRSFSVHLFKIINPTNEATSVSLTPLIEWVNISSTAQYTLEISESSQFYSLVYNQNTSATSQTIPDGVLVGATAYYVRVKAVDGALNVVSNSVKFTTLDLPVPKPVITKPTANESIAGNSVEVCWQEQNSKGFRVELSTSSSFPALSTTLKTTNAYTFCTTFDNLVVGSTYYIRVSAQSSLGSNMSEIISINTTTDTPKTVVKRFNAYFANNKGGENQLIIVSSENCLAEIKLYSATGVMLQNREIALSSGQNVLNIISGRFDDGLYILRMKTDTFEQTIKLLK